ncbi:MAG: DUF2059 domain-containing protein [Pseudomonadota bacterium]
MIRAFIYPATAIAMVVAAPAQAIAAQDDTETTEAVSKEQEELDKFLELFQIDDDGEPIAPEQLAKGEDVAARLLPDGSYRRVMADTMGNIVEPMLGSIDRMPLSTITTFAGIPEDEISPPDDATLRDLMEIVDPHYEERQQVMVKAVFDIMIELSDELEPAIRQGLAKAYARRFTAAELDDISAFLSTDTGTKFGSESFAVYSSREVIGATMEMMPLFLERFMGELQNPEELMGDIPPQRSLDELSDEERKKLAELLGVPVDDLGRSPAIEESYEYEEDAS